jgi:hypothetical protein
MEEIIWINVCLLEDCPQSSFWQVTGMVWNSSKAISSRIMPNLVAARGMPAKSESKSAQFFGDLRVSETGQPAHG